MSSFYAGLDLSELTTAICVIDSEGTIHHEVSVATDPAAIVGELKPYQSCLELVGMEAGTLSGWLCTALRKKRLPAISLDARAARGALATQRNKTDKNDARGLAQLLRAGWYTRTHIKSDESRYLRLQLAHRRALKRKLIDLEHCLRMSVKEFGARLVKKRDVLCITHRQRTRDKRLAGACAPLLRVLTALHAELATLDKLVAAAAKSDHVCRRLMTVPGVGPITALTYKAAVDDPKRFKSSRSVAAHFGLTPRRMQSGQSESPSHISRFGDQSVRTALYEAAFVLLVVSKSTCALRAWGLRLRQQKGTRFACVACARKLAVVLHRLWITETDFSLSSQK